jgi:cytochrome c-type biogenesis protein CcmH/NrfF
MAAEERRSWVRGIEVHLGRTAIFALVPPIIAAVVLALPATAETPDEQRVRVQRIEDAVLAPCCYTEPVSRHQSEVAVKIRIEIGKWVAGGKADQEILDTYVRRYGSRVLVDPRTKPGWWIPWVPWLGLVLAVVFGFQLLRRWRRANPLPAALRSPGPDVAALPDFDDQE